MQESKWNTKGRNIIVNLSKKDKEAEYWPRITKEKAKNNLIAVSEISQIRKALARIDSGDDPANVQATLLALTVATVANAIEQHADHPGEVLVCGGGAHNAALMTALAERLDPVTITSTATLGLDPDWVEAAAFAWLASRTLANLPGNLPSVTGADKPVVLGGIYPGGE